jgi:hypothetical protein
MAKKKLTFDAIFEGNDIKEDAKKKISAMLEDVVARKMGEEEEEEEPKEEDEEEDPEKMAEPRGHADDVDEEEEDEDEEYTQNPDNKENDVLTNEEEDEEKEKEEEPEEEEEDLTEDTVGKDKWIRHFARKGDVDTTIVHKTKYYDEKGKLLGNLEKGTPVTYTDKRKSYYDLKAPFLTLHEVQLEDGKKVYVSFADIGEPGSKSAVEEMKEDAAVELKNDLPALLRDSDILRVFKALNLNMGEVLRSAKAMTLDLAKNHQAEPMVAAFHKLLSAIKDDSSVSSRIAGDLKKAEAGKEEEEESYSEEFIDRLDQYLAYVAEQWSESNKIAIENGIKVQLAESFLSNIKGMYEQYNFTNIPTRDMVVELGNKVTVAENKLNEQIEKNVKLLEKYNKQRKEILVSEASKGLTVTQVEKFKKLTEDVSFEDEKTFKSKIVVIKENAFTKTAVKSDTKLETETGPDDQLLNERMSKYVDVISKNLKF